MKVKNSKTIARDIRRRRVRAKIIGTKDRPRLSVYRSNKLIYASLIDDENHRTLAAAKSPAADGRKTSPAKTAADRAGRFPGVNRAYAVGGALAKAALAKKIKKAVFDRSGYQYQGQIKALAEGAKNGGLEF